MNKETSGVIRRRIRRGALALAIGAGLGISVWPVNDQVDNSSAHGVTSEAPVDVFPRK